MAKLTARQAIAKVLSDGKSHKVPDIIKAAVPMTNLGGATPGQTIYSVLYSDNKKKGTDRQFISTGRGEFKLNGQYKQPVRATAAKKASSKKTSTARKSATKRTSSARKRSAAKRSSSPKRRSSARSGAAA